MVNWDVDPVDPRDAQKVDPPDARCPYSECGSPETRFVDELRNDGGWLTLEYRCQRCMRRFGVEAVEWNLGRWTYIDDEPWGPYKADERIECDQCGKKVTYSELEWLGAETGCKECSSGKC